MYKSLTSTISAKIEFHVQMTSMLQTFSCLIFTFQVND